MIDPAVNGSKDRNYACMGIVASVIVALVTTPMQGAYIWIGRIYMGLVFWLELLNELAEVNVLSHLICTGMQRQQSSETFY